MFRVHALKSAMNFAGLFFFFFFFSNFISARVKIFFCAICFAKEEPPFSPPFVRPFGRWGGEVLLPQEYNNPSRWTWTIDEEEPLKDIFLQRIFPPSLSPIINAPPKNRFTCLFSCERRKHVCQKKKKKCVCVFLQQCCAARNPFFGGDLTILHVL